jgi:hypothetical protein
MQLATNASRPRRPHSAPILSRGVFGGFGTQAIIALVGRVRALDRRRPTSLDNAVLLSGFHHRLLHKGEWADRLGQDKQPEFLPPDWIDSQRKPLRNTMHDRR